MTVTLLSITDQPEKHIEKCARVCYLSGERITETSHAGFLRGLLKSGHLSVFEHASASFLIEGVSRALSHQLVRHRIASFSQQSQRYVREDGFDFTVPESISSHPEAKKIFEGCVENIRDSYQKLSELGIRKEDARFLLPNATHTSLAMTANFREWLTIINLRVSKHAQWEIRQMAALIWGELFKHAPTVFGTTYFENNASDFEDKKRYFEEMNGTL